MGERYFARSASDNTDNWPFWFVADRKRGDVNVTGEVCDMLGVQRAPGQTLVNPKAALILARAANEAPAQ